MPVVGFLNAGTKHITASGHRGQSGTDRQLAGDEVGATGRAAGRLHPNTRVSFEDGLRSKTLFAHRSVLSERLECHNRTWRVLAHQKERPRQSGAASQSERVCSDQLANPPASVGVANSTTRGRYHDWRGYHHTHAWRHRYAHAWRHRTAIVRAAVVAIATAAAIRAAVKSRSAAASDFKD